MGRGLRRSESPQTTPHGEAPGTQTIDRTDGWVMNRRRFDTGVCQKREWSRRWAIRAFWPGWLLFLASAALAFFTFPPWGGSHMTWPWSVSRPSVIRYEVFLQNGLVEFLYCTDDQAQDVDWDRYEQAESASDADAWLARVSLHRSLSFDGVLLATNRWDGCFFRVHGSGAKFGAQVPPLEMQIMLDAVVLDMVPRAAALGIELPWFDADLATRGFSERESIVWHAWAIILAMGIGACAGIGSFPGWLMAMRQRWLVRRWERLGHCLSCGYDVRGLGKGVRVCPECGKGLVETRDA